MKTDKSEDFLIIDGEVIALLPNVNFRVKIGSQDKKKETVVLAYTSGKIKKNRVKILVGDKVKMEISKKDLKKARIVYRYKKDDYRSFK
ncbi:translation initiation factor IF-1 [Anaplasmataceae bacterium AB001_6]|nr:translation initiation factor IF-1 [Anaplasmataceae bacterium AB001_6]